MHDDPSDKRKDSVYVEKVVYNELSNSHIDLKQVSNKKINNSGNNIIVWWL